MEELFTNLLDLPHLEVTHSEVSAHKIILSCKSTAKSSSCPVCLKKCNYVKDTYVRELRDLSISGKKVILRLSSRQFLCKDCNRHFHEQHSFASKNGTMTHRYEDFIYYRCQGVELRYVSIQEDIRWATVRNIFEKKAESELKSVDLYSQVTHLGIDEISLKKGHKDFVAVVVNLETGQVLDILPDRSKSYLKSYFLEKGDAFCKQIICFCSDMWEGYLNCAKEVFPNATIIADRFHFFSYLNKEVDRIRRYMRKKLPKQEELKHLRWSLLKPKDSLTSQQLEDLEQTLSKPEYGLLKQTWIARNEFRDILQMVITKQEAQIKIEQWIEKNTTQPNRFLQRFIDFYNNWKNYILNYFTFRHTTSIIEGINNKLKLIKRRAYGFLTFNAFKIRARIEFI